MEVIELIPGLHFLRFPVGHAYLCQDPDGLTLIDTSVPGSAPQIAAAVRALGHDTGDLRQLAAHPLPRRPRRLRRPDRRLGRRRSVRAPRRRPVPARRRTRAAPGPRRLGTAPLRPGQPPATSGTPAPVRIDHELADGDELAFGGGAIAVAVPGHTPGSVAFYLPGRRVLLAGDAAARRPAGLVMPGVFNANRAQAAASFRQLARLDAEIACFGHGEPVTQSAAAQLQEATQQLHDRKQ